MKRALVWVIPGLVLFVPSRPAAADCAGGAQACLPELSEHGSIAGVSVSAPLPTETGNLPPGASGDTSKPLSAEGDVDHRDEETLRGFPPADPADAAFSASLSRRVGSLEDCRMEVARTRQVRPTDLGDEAARLQLWVAPDGRVVDSLVATDGTLGPRFADCVKREVQGWRLMAPRGGKGAYADVAVQVPAKGGAHVSGPPPAP